MLHLFLREAWKAFSGEIKNEIQEVAAYFDRIAGSSSKPAEINDVKLDLLSTLDPVRKDVMKAMKEVLRLTRFEASEARNQLITWKDNIDVVNEDRYCSHLYSESQYAATNITEVPAEFSGETENIPGYQILNKIFDHHLEHMPELCAFGEDVGHIGDVNQAFAGLQEKYGKYRVFDTGIRENTNYRSRNWNGFKRFKTNC